MTLLVVLQEGHPACKRLNGGCWRGYLSGARCIFAYGLADTTVTHSLASVKSRLVLVLAHQVILDIVQRVVKQM